MTNTTPFTLVEQVEAFNKFTAVGLHFVVPGMGLYDGPCSHHHPRAYDGPSSILRNFLHLNPLARKVVAGETTYVESVNPILERYDSSSSRLRVQKKMRHLMRWLQRCWGR